jgi:membrane protein
VISAVLSALSGWIIRHLPLSEAVLQFINFAVSFMVITFLFAVIYEVLPDVYIHWRDVWVGAAVTSLLFSIGKYLIGLYLGNSSIASSYGAAGSFVVLLLWIYYSAFIFLFGAEFTQVYARTFGSRIVPNRNAVFVNEEKLPQPGKPSAPTESEKNSSAAAPKLPQPATSPSRASEGGSGGVMLGIIASLATFLVGILIGSDQRRDRAE